MFPDGATTELLGVQETPVSPVALSRKGRVEKENEPMVLMTTRRTWLRWLFSE